MDERGSLTNERRTDGEMVPNRLARSQRGSATKARFAVPVEILSDIHDRLLRAERTIERFEAAALESKVRSVHRHFLCRCGETTAVTMLGVCQACYDKVRNG